MISSYISSLIGSPPSGYEPLAYVLNAIVLLFLLSMVYRFLRALFGRWIK